MAIKGQYQVIFEIFDDCHICLMDRHNNDNNNNNLKKKQYCDYLKIIFLLRNQGYYHFGKPYKSERSIKNPQMFFFSF